MPNIYELSQEFLSLCSMLESTDDETSEEVAESIAAMFADNEAATEKKIDGYIAVIRNYENAIDGIKFEVDRLAKRHKIYDSAIVRLKDRIKQMMLITERDRLDGNLGYFRLQNKPQSVVVEDEKQIPGQFWREKISREIDKKTIANVLKSGDTIPGVKLSDPEKTMVMK